MLEFKFKYHHIMANFLDIDRINLNLQSATINQSNVVPSQFKIFASPSLTPQNVRPIADVLQGTGSNSTAQRVAGNSSLVTQGLQQRNQLASRNDTMHNSHIQGRKVDSPKIYVKDVNERPKTSAQQVRKNAQQTAPSVLKKPKTSKNRNAEPKKLTNFLNVAPQTNKDAEQRKFDFKFVAAKDSKEKAKKMNSKRKGILNKSQVINLNSDKTGHHRTQTINFGLVNYEGVNMKIAQGQRGSAGEMAMLPNSILSGQDSSQHVSWGAIEQLKNRAAKNSGSNSNIQQRKRHLSVNLPKSTTNADSASMIQEQQLINIQLPNKNQKKMQQTTSKVIPTKPPVQNGFSKVQRKSQHMHNQTMVIQKLSEYQTDVSKLPKTQRSGHQPCASSQSVVLAQERQRTRSGDNNETKSGSKNKVTKSSRSKKDSHSHTGLHELKNQARRNNAHFSFDVTAEQENVQRNSQKNIVKEKHSGKKCDLSRSDGSSVSQKATNIGTIGRLFKNNFFVDGEQLLRHMSPGTPDKLGSIEQNQNQICNVHKLFAKDSSQSRSRGRSSTRQHSGTRPISKAIHKHTNEDNKNTLDHDTLHAHQKNKIHVFTEHDETFSQKHKKGFLSHQLSANDHHEACSVGSHNAIEKSRDIDRLVKNNLKKKQKMNTEELIKKFMEQTQKKQKKAEIVNRNKEVRIMNAKPSTSTEQERLQALLSKIKYKKKRSKSCIHKTDNILLAAKEFDKRYPREKSNENNKTSVLSNLLDPLLSKKHLDVQGRNAAVVELSLLKKEIDDEIRRDRKEGKLDVLSPVANPSLVKKVPLPRVLKVANKDLNLNKEQAQNYTSLRIKDAQVILERQNREDGNIKAKIRELENEKYFASSGHVINNLNTSKIQRFIEKQKKRNAAKKSLEDNKKQEKVMKVHQNLLNLHNFTQKDRLKHFKEQSFFKKGSSVQQSQLIEHLRNQPITNLNLKLGKKRSLDQESTRNENRTNSQGTNKIRIKPLGRRYGKKGFKEFDDETDLLEQTIPIDSSRLECNEIDNSIINIYRRHSGGSRDVSQNSNLRSALRSSSGDKVSPQPRSLSGGRQPDHPPLKVLRQTKLGSPGQRARFQPQSSGSAHLRRKHQQQIDQIEQSRKFFGKVSPDLIRPMSQTEDDRNNFASIDAPSKQLTSDQFESIEPTRTAKQIKKAHDNRLSSVGSQCSAPSFDQKMQELASKYGKLGEKESQLLVRLHTAAIKIQYHCRIFLNRAKAVNVKPHHELQIAKQATSEVSFQKVSSRDGTGQSTRKSMIPALNLDKISREQKARAQTDPYLNLPVKEEGEPLASTSRSIFARNTFREFMEKHGFTSVEELNIQNLPEMMRLREQAIDLRHSKEENKISNLLKQKQISPRTFDHQKRELEVWVTKESEDVKKSKKIIEDDQARAAKILLNAQTNSEHIQRILKGGNLNGNGHNASTRSQNIQQTLTDRASSARLGSRRGEGKTQLLGMIYGKDQNSNAEPRQRLSSFEASQKQSGEILSVSDNDRDRENKSQNSLTNTFDDPLSKVIVLNPAAFKSFPQTAQKTLQKQQLQSNQKSSIKTSDNPESLREMIAENDINKLRTPNEIQNTERSLDLDGIVDPELEARFNTHISQQLLGKLIQEERETSLKNQSDQESSAKPSKKNGDIAPMGPFKQRRQAYEVPSNEKNLHRITSQQQLQDNLNLDLSSGKPSDNVSDDNSATQNVIITKPKKHQLQIPEDEDDLARKVMEVSPVSNSTGQIAFSKDDLKSSIRSENFFLNNLNKINSSQATSFEDLQEFTSEQKEIVAHLQGSECFEIQGIQMHGVTTPLSEGNNDKIRIEINGQQLSGGNDGFQPALSFQLNALVGAPVSPMSNDSIGGIKCGATSLSSNTSEERNMPLPGVLQVIPEISEDKRSKLTENILLRPKDLEEIKLQISSPETLNIKSTANNTLESSQQKLIAQDLFGKQLPKELRDQGEKLTNEIFQLLLLELSIDLPAMTNRNIQRTNESQNFKDQAHGIKTDLFAIERYVDEIQTEIMNNAKDFMDTLTKPISKDSIVTLNMLQNSEIGSCEHFEENCPQILHLDLYLTLEKRRKEKREKQIQEMEEADSGPKTQQQINGSVLRTFLAECEHIHNKVLFDCINDSLLQFKPFGKEGMPLPWSRQNRRLKPAEDFTINEIFEIVKHDLFRWAITQSGTLPRREMVYQGVFDQDLFDEIREKKLVHMLCVEMIENEPKWLNYEFEHAQVKIDIGDMILEQLVNETIAILSENAQKDFTCLDNTNNIEDSWPSAN